MHTRYTSRLFVILLLLMQVWNFNVIFFEETGWLAWLSLVCGAFLSWIAGLLIAEGLRLWRMKRMDREMYFIISRYWDR